MKRFCLEEGDNWIIRFHANDIPTLSSSYHLQFGTKLLNIKWFSISLTVIKIAARKHLMFFRPRDLQPGGLVTDQATNVLGLFVQSVCECSWIQTGSGTVRLGFASCKKQADPSCFG